MSGSLTTNPTSPAPTDLSLLVSTSPASTSAGSAPAAPGLGAGRPSDTQGAGTGGFAQQLSSAIQALLVQFQGGASAFTASTKAGSTTDVATPVTSTASSSQDNAQPQNPVLNVLQEVEQAIAGASRAPAAGSSTGGDSLPVSLFSTALQQLAYVASQAVRAYSSASALAGGSSGLGLASFA